MKENWELPKQRRGQWFLTQSLPWAKAPRHKGIQHESRNNKKYSIAEI